MGAEQLPGILQVYGGYGLSSILMVAIWWLVRYIQKMHEKSSLREQEINQKTTNREQEVNKQLLEVMAERIKIDTRYEEAMRALQDIYKTELRSLKESIERLQSDLRYLRESVERTRR